jgi:predicted aconitase with swiveling domain
MTGPITLRGRVLSPGEASGVALMLEEPLSLWGGMDPATGRVIDAHHPQRGVLLAGRVVVMSSTRGSSSSSSILAEAARAGTAPAALLLGDADLILAIGATVAQELYGRALPIIRIEPSDMEMIHDGDRLVVGSDGTVVVADFRDLRTLSGS